MSDPDDDVEAEETPKGVTEEDILADMQSRYADVVCPVHGVAPKFEMDEAGGVIETLCCETLAQIFRELRDGEPPAEG